MTTAVEVRRIKFAALVYGGRTATSAARECGYIAPEKAGYRLSRDARVRREIERLHKLFVEQQLAQQPTDPAQLDKAERDRRILGRLDCVLAGANPALYR